MREAPGGGDELRRVDVRHEWRGHGEVAGEARELRGGHLENTVRDSGGLRRCTSRSISESHDHSFCVFVS